MSEMLLGVLGAVAVVYALGHLFLWVSMRNYKRRIRRGLERGLTLGNAIAAAKRVRQ